MAIIQQIRKIIQNNILSRVSCFRQKSLKNFDIRTLIRKEHITSVQPLNCTFSTIFFRHADGILA